MDVQQDEPAERQVDGFGQGELLSGLGQRNHLGLGGHRGGSRHLVAAGRIRVDRVHPAVPSDDASQGHGHVAASCPDVGTAPAFSQAQAIERRRQRPPVHVVAESQFDHGWHDTTTTTTL